MPRRFIDLSKHRQAFRKLDAKTFRAFYYLWDQCDDAGVYLIDTDQFKLDNGFALPFEALLALPGNLCVRMAPDRILLTDFIATNYTKLKEGYNPHKPAFRALLRNELTLNASYTQACFKLEDEEEGEDEDEDKGGTGETSKRGDQGTSKIGADPAFEVLWVAFERYGSKSKALEYWRKLSPIDRLAITAKAPAYVASTPGCEFRKQLEGWINPEHRLWERPIVKRSNGSPTSSTAPMSRNAPIETDLVTRTKS